MTLQPFRTSRLLPFRAISAGGNRVNLLEKLGSRPTVANVPAFAADRREHQDASLSGMTRSLYRRLSGLNLPVAMNRIEARKVA